MSSRSVLAVALALAVAGCGHTARPRPAPTPAPPQQAGTGWRAVAQPVDPRQQTALAFGRRSHWLQPWRAYFDTWPAARMRDAPGIHFNAPAAEARRDLRLVAGSGFARVRIEVPWSAMDVRDPRRLADPAGTALALRAAQASGLRPLLLLNADDTAPGPVIRGTLSLTRPAPAGARAVDLAPDSARLVVPGRTGFDDGDWAAGVLITALEGGRAELSRPLPRALGSGPQPATLLAFAPFARPELSSGAPNPAFERTLSGWLDYVGAVARAGRAVLGDAFDLEIWNETTLHGRFLDAQSYFNPPSANPGRGDIQATILARTVAYLRDPSHGFGAIGIGDGFANQTPFPAAATAPPGLTALDKHPYPRALSFPADTADLGAAQALGPDGRPTKIEPRYDALFPEYYLTGIQTEHLVRDLSPLKSRIGEVVHGRDRDLWITEIGLAPPAALREPDRRRFQAKVVLRTLTAFVAKGAATVFFYATSGHPYGLIPPAGRGLALPALRRFLHAFAGPDASGPPRRLRLEYVADREDRAQWSDRPRLHDRDVLFVGAFQVSAARFTVPVYVMTRDLARPFAPEPFRIRLGGLDGESVRARLVDPLTRERAPVRVVARTAGSATFELEATDYPRLLLLQDEWQPADTS